MLLRRAKRLPDPAELDALLKVCQAHGVTHIDVCGTLSVDLDHGSVVGALPKSEQLDEWVEATAKSTAQPTDDELLYGREAYGIGVGPQGRGGA